MKHPRIVRPALSLLPLIVVACSGRENDSTFFEPRSDQLIGEENSDADTSASSRQPVVGNFPGSGNAGAGAPLVAGISPNTAGDCASAPSSEPPPGSPEVETICLFSDDDPETPAATIEQVLETVADQTLVHVRLTLNPSFVDNSYGDAAIGWERREPPRKAPAAAPDDARPKPPPPAPNDAPPAPDDDAAAPDDVAPAPDDVAPPPDDVAVPPDAPQPPPDAPRAGPEREPKPERAAHTFRDLVGSDHAEIQLFDAEGELALHFKLDYLSESDTAPSGYASLGVSGGDGKLIVGEPASILAATTSLDRNLNGCGLASFTESSPATDADYTPNPDASAWDYRVVYEVWVDAAAFGSAGFGTAAVEFVHASPSKSGRNSETVTPAPCLPPDDGVGPEREPPTIR